MPNLVRFVLSVTLSEREVCLDIGTHNTSVRVLVDFRPCLLPALEVSFFLDGLVDVGTFWSCQTSYESCAMLHQ